MQRHAGKQGRSHRKSKAEVRVLLFCYIPRSVKDCQESLVARKRPGRQKKKRFGSHNCTVGLRASGIAGSRTQ